VGNVFINAEAIDRQTPEIFLKFGHVMPYSQHLPPSPLTA